MLHIYNFFADNEKGEQQKSKNKTKYVNIIELENERNVIHISYQKGHTAYEDLHLHILIKISKNQ